MKVKVAYICHFSTPELRKQLVLKTFWLSNLIRKIVGKPLLYYADFATWNADFIKSFEDNQDYDFYIVTHHLGLKPKAKRFQHKTINYIVLKEKEHLGLKILNTILGRQNQDDYIKMSSQIKDEIDKIRPDVVVVCGAENPTYSYSSLLISDIPIILIMQTLLNSSKRIAMNVGSPLRRDIENKIIKHIKYFCTFDMDEVKYVNKMNPRSFCMCLPFPSSVNCEKSNSDFRYDFVFFSYSLTRNKGVEDALLAFCHVCKTYPHTKMNVIGGASDDYLHHLKTIINQYGCSGNVDFCGNFPTKDELFSQVQKSKMAVLPGITAPLNSTVREAMFMQMPTIVYETSVTKIINKDSAKLLTAEMENVDDLGKKMLYAIENPVEMQQLATKAKVYAEKTFSPTAVSCQLKDNINAVYNHFYHNVEIPDYLIL